MNAVSNKIAKGRWTSCEHAYLLIKKKRNKKNASKNADPKSATENDQKKFALIIFLKTVSPTTALKRAGIIFKQSWKEISFLSYINFKVPKQNNNWKTLNFLL